MARKEAQLSATQMQAGYLRTNTMFVIRAGDTQKPTSGTSPGTQYYPIHPFTCPSTHPSIYPSTYIPDILDSTVLGSGGPAANKRVAVCALAEAHQSRSENRRPMSTVFRSEQPVFCRVPL